MIKAFTLSIAMWIVWSSSQLMSTRHFTKMRNNLIVERPTLITMDPGGNPKNAELLLN